jgi:serine/threonine protein kinase/Flp pilus assembly protein TadD/predicted metal-dependent hydrolase
MPGKVGKTISHYRILEKLGGGGMGVVYKAQDVKLNRLVALKFLSPELVDDEKAKKRFIHEARSASALDHPNIYTIHEVGETTEGELFICMTYYEGETLQKKLQSGQLATEVILDVAEQIAAGLARAHEAGIVHRDIKPANVMITYRGEVKILDFGVSKLATQTKLTATGAPIGTLAYMSPEQAMGQAVDHRSDIFSLGVILYELLAGRHPFAGENVQVVLNAILNEPAPELSQVRPDLPTGLDHLIGKTLEKEREKRQQSAEELRSGLGKIREGLERAAEAETATTMDPSRPKKRNLVPRLALGVLAVVAILFMTFQLFKLVSGPRGKVTARTIAVLPFQNDTGDESLDYLRRVIPNLLITNLEQSKYLDVTTWERLADLLKLREEEMEIVDVGTDLGFELCRMDDVGGVILGSFTKIGNTFATDVKLLEVDSKNLIAGASAKGEGVESLLEKQIDELSRAISKEARTKRQDDSEEDFDIRDVTTHSLDAYVHYQNGVDLFHRFLSISAAEELSRATTIDSTFAMAHYYLGRTHQLNGDLPSSRRAYGQAIRFANRASERERLVIRAAYALRVEDDIGKAIVFGEELVRRFPREKEGHHSLGVWYASVGRFEEAIKSLERALELDSRWSASVNMMAYAQAYLRDYKEAHKTVDRYELLLPGDVNPFDTRADLYVVAGDLDGALESSLRSIEIDSSFIAPYMKTSYIHALREDYEEALQHLETFNKMSLREIWQSLGMRQMATISHLLGRRVEAAQHLHEAIAIAERNRNSRYAGWACVVLGLVHADMGEYEKALDEIRKGREATEDRPRRDWWVAVCDCLEGFVAVKAGRLETAKSGLEKAKESLSDVRRSSREILEYWLSVLAAEIALMENVPEQAVAIATQAKLPNPYFWRNDANLVPIERDGLARALHAMGRIEEAISEYERLTKFDPRKDERFWILPIYRYRLAKLYEENGERDLAMEEFQRFLDLWKEADPARPEMMDARSRIVALRSVGSG